MSASPCWVRSAPGVPKVPDTENAVCAQLYLLTVLQANTLVRRCLESSKRSVKAAWTVQHDKPVAHRRADNDMPNRSGDKPCSEQRPCLLHATSRGRPEQYAVPL